MRPINKISILLLFIPSILLALPPKGASVKWGPELKGSRKGTITTTLGYDDSGFYVLGTEKRTPFIQKLDKKLDEVATFTFEEKDKVTKTKYEYEGSRFFNNKLYVFKSVTNTKEKSRELYVQEINKNSMQESGAPKKICELTYLKSSDKGFFQIHVNREDKENTEADQKLMIAIGIPTDKDEKEKYTLIMCDHEMNTIWKKNYEIPYAAGLFIRNDFLCDKDGNGYVLGKLYKEKVKETSRGKQNYSFHIIAYTENGENSVDYEVKLLDKFITDISFGIANSGNIVAGGFYSKKGTSSVDGAYFLSLDAKTKEIKTSSVKEFDIDFITQGMSEKDEAKARKREEKGKDQEMLEYDLHDLIKRDDGGVVLIGEQYYSYTVTNYTANGVGSSTTYYHYNNIIIINIDNAGKIEWAQTIPKRQQSNNDGGYYSSYALAVTEDKLRFIFNDNRANLNPKKQGELKNYTFRDKDGIVTLATVSRDGKVTREALVNDSEIEVGVRPKVCDQINDNQILLFGEKRSKDQFAIVDFE